ncbi:MAG: class I SAM-dependent methyltransferase [Proteobacteria bacterium]|nr:class I SAM-dependent methyltransferase [Pseudomonadota bacterium]
MTSSSNAPRPRSGTVNGPLWGERAGDWAAIQEAQFRQAYDEVLDRLALPRGARLCDAGCGAGLAAQIAAGRGLQVCGVDAAQALLAIARQRVPGADLRHGDLEDLPFADGSVDAVTGFNAFQYAADPVAALAEARRITRAGGVVVVMTWGSPQGMEAASLVAALKPLLPAPPPGAPGPFALSDPEALRQLATSAGCRPVEVHDTQTAWQYPDLATALRGLASSGVAARAIAHSGAAAVDAAHETALAPFRRPDGSYRIGAAFRWMLAQA